MAWESDHYDFSDEGEERSNSRASSVCSIPYFEEMEELEELRIKVIPAKELEQYEVVGRGASKVSTSLTPVCDGISRWAALMCL
jgi:hypothetical protein